jgi:hypothetical protein
VNSEQNEQIIDVKRQISRSFLGKSGIHGVGIGPDGESITIHVRSDADLETTGILDSIREKASPFAVQVIREEAASIK